VPEAFEMVVEEVWRIAGRGPIITGPIHSGVVSVGDAVRLTDDLGSATASVVGIEFHMPPGQGGLLLSHIQGELRQGQVVRLARPAD
jgi:translation elongation factor EF-Tu-like GTPase